MSILKAVLKVLSWCEPSAWIVALPVNLLILLKEKQHARFVEQMRIDHPEVKIEEGLDPDQIDYVKKNIVKHRIAFWLILKMAYFLWHGIDLSSLDQLGTLLVLAGTVIGAVIVGWFAISLKSLPTRYGFLGIVITLTMFTAFMGFASMIPIVAYQKINTWIFEVAIEVYILIYIAAMLYDFADLLNLGLEPKMKEYFEDPQVQVIGELVETIQAQVRGLEALVAELRSERSVATLQGGTQ